MLKIINKNSIKGREVHKGIITYYIEGIYEYKEEYQIHLRSKDKYNIDELLILKRNREQNQSNEGVLYKYYKLYNNNEPHSWVGLTNTSLNNKDSLMKALDYILNKK